MSDKSPNDQGPNERVCNRINMPRTLLLELVSGDVLRGKSVDLSPRGVLVKMDAVLETDLMGQAVTLFIISPEGEFSIGYPCTVVRQEHGAVALEVNRNSAAAFGNYLTKALLGRPQTE